MGRTLLDKIWDAHTVRTEEGGRTVLYIDRQYIHEVTSPVAFAGLARRGVGVVHPDRITATVDHNIPTVDQHLPIAEPQSRHQVETLRANCARYGIEHFGMGDPRQGIVHIIGPELGLTQPGMTIVCGDSHTSTHGALGAVAFGVGTSEVEMVLASQCILQGKPRAMRITVDGTLPSGTEAKDIILHIIARITASGGTDHFIEFTGEAIRSLSMEGRMTVCNMSIECGARGGMIAPDQTTFDYLRGRERAPQGEAFDAAVARWRELYSDADARFDREYRFDAAEIAPMITYGTNPGMGMAVDAAIPADADPKALEYMGFDAGERLLGKPVDYVFVGSCTNGRIEDLRRFAPKRGQARRQSDRRGQITVIRKAEIDLLRADNAALLRIEHHPERAGGRQRGAVLQREDVVARAEEAVHFARPCRVHHGFALTRRAQGADMDARQREKQPARHHLVITRAEGKRVALAALLHGDKERVQPHAALKIAVRRADGKGFRICFIHKLRLRLEHPKV